MKKIIFILFLLISSFSSYSQQVTARTDTTNIRIGEQVSFEIYINDTANVILPKLEGLQGLEVVKEDKLDTVKNLLVKRYLLTSFDSGAYYIPSQQIFIKNRAFFTDSILINVATVPVDTTKQKMFEIKTIKTEPYVFDDFKPLLKWILFYLIVLGIIIFIVIRFVKKSRGSKVIEEKPSIPPHEEALEKLKELDSKLLWQNNKVKEYYSELTEIVRAYIERELKIPALEVTSEEVMQMLKSGFNRGDIETSEDTLSKLNSLLFQADLVKFAKSKPLSIEIEEDRKDAEAIINNLTTPKHEETEKEDELE